MFGRKKEINLIPELKQRIAKALLGSTDDIGKTPSVTFSSQIEVFEECPIVRESVIHTAMEIVGTGFFTSVAGSDALKLKIGELGPYSAKEAIDMWNGENNVDEKLLTVAIELVAYGNSFLYITENGLKPINIKCITRIVRNSKDIPIIEAYDIVLSGEYAGKTLKWGEFIHVRANVTSSSAPLGTGVIRGLLETYDNDYPSMLEVYYAIEKAMKKGFDRFGQPVEFIHPDAPDADMTDINTEVKKLRNGGGRITTNIPVGITSNMPAKTEGYNDWIKTEFDKFIMALGDPSLKASVESGFTEASIKGSIELFRKKVNSFRRIIKREVEKLWAKVLIDYGFDPMIEQLKLEFGADLIEWTVADLLKAVEDGVVSPDEARIILRKKAGMELAEKTAPIKVIN